MKTLVLTVLGLLLATVAAAEEVDRTIDAHSRSRVSVSIVEGSLDIVGWDRNEVRVQGSIGDDVEKFIFERDGKDILIKVKVPNQNSGRKDHSANLEIRVPAGSSLDVGTVRRTAARPAGHGHCRPCRAISSPSGCPER